MSDSEVTPLVRAVFSHAAGWESLTAADEFLHVTHQNTTVL